MKNLLNNLSCSIALLSVLNVSAQSKKSSQPNIVFIIADDLGCDDISPYGNKGVQTPNLQRLSESGMQFSNAYLTVSSSSPSRSSIVTGRWPVSNGQSDLATGLMPKYNIPFPEFFDNIDYFPQVLKNNGYYTAHSGKWHIGYHWLNPTGPALEGFDRTNGGGGESGCQAWDDLLMKRDKEKPFFFWLAAHDPHAPWTAPKVHSPKDVTVPPYIPDTEYMRQELAVYYDEIHRLDGYIGSFIEKLKAEGVYENTMIIFMSDNGKSFPRSKSHIYDAGMKTPLLISWPEKIKPKQSAKQLVSVIDLAPTFIDIAGLDPESYTFQGRSILPILKNVTSPELNKYVISEQNWHWYSINYRSVRDNEGYLYVFNGRPDRSGIAGNFIDYMVELNDAGELTDLQKDMFRAPRESEELYNYRLDVHQESNLVNKTKYAKKLKELQRVFKKWQELTGDKLPKNEIPDWDQRPYSDIKPYKGTWGDTPGTRNYGIENGDKLLKLTKQK